jgi:uncharacterized membrane protein YeaQ/YmgE (transglycosylase-associated protein family)
MGIIWTLLIGFVAGWLAGRIAKGRGFGVLGNIVVGLLGALVGRFLLGGFFLAGGLLGELLSALVGSLILLFLLRLVK